MRLTGSKEKLGGNGFTLIELLTVIFIISVLAAMTVMLFTMAREKALRKRAEAQKAQLMAAIDSYHSHHGIYPPDNPGYPERSVLYYELTGVQVDASGTFTDVAGRPIDLSQFAGNMGGIVNSAKPPEKAPNFLARATDIKTVEYAANALLLQAPSERPSGLADPPPPIPSKPEVNVWYYVSTKPTNNPNSYDLWTYVYLRGTNRALIANWRIK